MLAPLLAGLVLAAQSVRASTPSVPGPGTPATQQLSAYEAELDARYRTLIARNGSGTNKALQARLIRMGKQDQQVRKPMMTLPQSQWTPAMTDAQVKTDRQLTAELRRIVSRYGWPTISLVGAQAADDAMLILVHSPDHTWQKSMLPQLETLVDKDQIIGSSLALVIDKMRIAAGEKQLFGTQFAFHDGKMMMYAVEDPATLDARRAKWLLPPENVYKQMMAQFYPGLTMTNDIVPPPPPSSGSGK